MVRDAFRMGRDARLPVDSDAIVLERPDLVCVSCGPEEHVLAHRGRGICV